jgi:excisionase family DNA binding protein
MKEDVLAVNIGEAARRLGASPRTVATLVSRKELTSRKIGRRRVIPVISLEAFLRHDHPTRPTANVMEVRGDRAQ